MIVHSGYPRFYLTLKQWHGLHVNSTERGCDGSNGAVRCSGEVQCDEVDVCDGDEYGCAGNHYCLVHRASSEAYWRNTSDAYWNASSNEMLLHQRYLSGIAARQGSLSGPYEVASINRVLTRRTRGAY